MKNKERRCKDCGIDITGLGRRYFCASCAKKSKREHKREQIRRYRARNVKVYVKSCRSCGKEIPGGLHAPMRCAECLVIRKKRPSVRKPGGCCVVCGSDISERGCRAKYCYKCKEEIEDARQSAHMRKIRASADHKDKLRKYRKTSRLLRRGREAGAVSDLTTKQWEDVLASFDNKCAYCGESLESPDREHFIPLVKGGGTTASNILPSCKRCNTKKSGKHPLDWLVTKPHGLVKFAELSNYLASK